MGFATALLTVFFLYAAAIAPTTIHSFNCSSSSEVTCNGLVGYVSPNSTTLSNISTLFGISINNLLGANNLPPATSANRTVAANQTIKIPFPCLCANGTGYPKQPPVYKVVSGDTLYHIAAEVFAGLVTFDQIQAFNRDKIANVSLINVGQELQIPLPCSCDEVNGERVVHYGYVVEYGSSVAAIAQQFNTAEETLLKLNGLASAADLKAAVAIDVPLKACTSMVNNTSLDYPLLVADGTYSFTAGNCVQCTCNAAKNWTLQCWPSNVNSSIWNTCPNTQCKVDVFDVKLGNPIYLTSSGACNRTICAYAGYTNQTILTTPVLDSENYCSDNNNNAPKSSLQGQSWSFILISVHLLLLCLHFIQ